MTIKVRVLNSDVENIEELLPHIPEEDVASILTSDYVQKVNQGISHRIQQRELVHAENLERVAKACFR